jgi:hypothetical protein
MEILYWQGKGKDGKTYTITHMEHQDVYCLWRKKTCILPNLIKSGYKTVEELRSSHPEIF